VKIVFLMSFNIYAVLYHVQTKTREYVSRIYFIWTIVTSKKCLNVELSYIHNILLF